MARLHRQRDDEELDAAALSHDVEGWWGIKYQTKLLGQKVDEGKKALLKKVRRFGEVQPETGSFFLELDEPVSDRKILKLKAQRAVSTRQDSEEIEKILRSKGLWDQMIEWEPVLDEGKVHAAYFDRLITDEELSRMFPKSEYFSLILLDDDDKPVN